MIYLEKFNNDKIDSNYLNLVFAEFIDDGADVFFTDNIWEIYITEPKISCYITSVSDIDEYLDLINNLNETYLDIKSCINKIKDEMPNIKIDLKIEEAGERNDWVDTIVRNVHLKFILF